MTLIPSEDSIKNKVMDAIQKESISMKPRWELVLRAALTGVGVLLFFGGVLILISFIVFSLHQNGAWFAPSFGVRGWIIIFQTLPIILVFLSLVFFVLLEILVHKFRWAYRMPLLYSVIGLVVISAMGGVFFAPMHRPLSQSTRIKQLPVVGGFYRHFEPPRFNDLTRGIVVEVASGSLVIDDLFRGTSTVFFSTSTRIPIPSEFITGDRLVIFGKRDRDDNSIKAVGVQKIFE